MIVSTSALTKAENLPVMALCFLRWEAVCPVGEEKRSPHRSSDLSSAGRRKRRTSSAAAFQSIFAIVLPSASFSHRV